MGLVNLKFLVDLEEFIEFACSKPEWMDGNKIKCPCTHTKCRNRSYHQIDTVKYHLMNRGMMFGQDKGKWNQIQFKILVMPNQYLSKLKMHTIVWLWMLSGLISILRKYRMNLPI